MLGTKYGKVLGVKAAYDTEVNKGVHGGVSVRGMFFCLAIYMHKNVFNILKERENPKKQNRAPLNTRFLIKNNFPLYA